LYFFKKKTFKKNIFLAKIFSSHKDLMLGFVALFAYFCDPILLGDRFELVVKESNSNIVIELSENDGSSKILSCPQREVITKPLAKINSQGCAVVVWQSSDANNAYVEMTSYYPVRGWSSPTIVSDATEEIIRGVYTLSLDEENRCSISWDVLDPESSVQQTEKRKFFSSVE
jgi:hypothetical protein